MGRKAYGDLRAKDPVTKYGTHPSIIDKNFQKKKFRDSN
jgi:hypothetical protein